MAYGQTGSGKSFTITGASSVQNVEDLAQHPLRGLIPRVFDYLFWRTAREERNVSHLTSNYLSLRLNTNSFSLISVEWW
jgi:hypothetical protein